MVLSWFRLGCVLCVWWRGGRAVAVVLSRVVGAVAVVLSGCFRPRRGPFPAALCPPVRAGALPRALCAPRRGSAVRAGRVAGGGPCALAPRCPPLGRALPPPPRPPPLRRPRAGACARGAPPPRARLAPRGHPCARAFLGPRAPGPPVALLRGAPPVAALPRLRRGGGAAGACPACAWRGVRRGAGPLPLPPLGGSGRPPRRLARAPFARGPFPAPSAGAGAVGLGALRPWSVRAGALPRAPSRGRVPAGWSPLG